MDFVSALASYCVASGIGAFYATSGVSIQDGMRRSMDPEPATVVLFRQTGGESFAQDETEEQAVQVLVDSATVSGARAAARAVFELLHETVATTISGHRLLWLRGVAPPQDIGPSLGNSERFTVSTNFTARLVR
jgi:hypothetical protein